MNDLEIIKRHLTPDIPFTLKYKDENGNEKTDTLMLKPFNVAQQTLAFSVSKKMRKLPKNEKGEPDMNEEVIKQMFDLFLSVMKRSYPEMDNETAENFISTNYVELVEVMEKLSPKPKNIKDIDKIKARYKKQEENK